MPCIWTCFTKKDELPCISLDPVDDAILVQFAKDGVFVVDVVTSGGQTLSTFLVVMNLFGLLVTETEDADAITDAEGKHD